MNPPIVDPRPVEWYIRISYYILLCLWPVIGMAFAASYPPRSGGAFAWGSAMIATGVALVGTTVAVAHVAFTRLHRGAGLRPVGWLGCGWLVANGAALMSVLGYGAHQGAFPLLVVGALLASSFAALFPVLRTRTTVLTTAVFAALYVVGAAVALPGRPVTRLVVGYQAVALGVAYLAGTWLTMWLLKVVWELDASRTVQARLAVAEERLRISRDLHDIFGRTLATISVKASLAAELSRRDRGPQAAGEMDAVRQIADVAGREVRQVVHGARAMDLAGELDGARSVLTSAGVACEVAADVAWIRPEVAERLGWVVREAVTNILRHSQATWCRITVGSGDPVVLVVVNDVPLTGTSGTGKGLAGMAQRVAEIGGTLGTDGDGSRFRLTVTVPNRPGPTPRTDPRGGRP